MPARRDLMVKVGQAIALQVGFYLLGITMALALLALPVIQLVYRGQFITLSSRPSSGTRSDNESG